MFLTYLQLISGFFILLIGGDVLVRGAVNLAHKVGVTPLIIGLTFVAFGTSAPELIISIEAALDGIPGIAVGNIVGSNIANILLVLGIPAVFYPITTFAKNLTRDVLFMVGSSTLFLFLCWGGVLGSSQGLLLTTCLLIFLIGSYLTQKANPMGPDDAHYDTEASKLLDRKTIVSIGLIFIGVTGLLLGSHLLIQGAVELARQWGVSETVIGLTIIAVGTSLPELTTSIVAAIRKHTDIAVGNVIGSNLFNTLGVMGITPLFVPVLIPKQILYFDIWIMMIASLLLLGFTMYKKSLGLKAGLVFIILYLSFVTMQFYGFHDLMIQKLGLI